MVKRVFALTLAALAAAAFMGFPASAEEKKPAPTPGTGEKKPETPVDKAKTDAKKAGQEAMPGGMDPEMMKKCMEAGTPGPHHKNFEQFVGKWNYTMEWQMTPEMPAESSTGTAEYKLIMDGRFLQEDVTGPGMDPNGPAMRGTSVLGYNNTTKRYESIWFDNHGTGMMVFTGTCSEDGKTITMSGEYADPMADGKLKKARTVAKVVDKDKHTFEFFEPGPDGKEFRCMLITYTRAK